MSLHYELSPVEVLCGTCHGFGRVSFELCRLCDGIGRVLVEGGPSFGCKTTLADCSPGSVVSIGNGDRGMVLHHHEGGTPTTDVCLIDPLFEIQAAEPTRYPSCTGVISVAVTYQTQKPNDKHRHIDHLDPMTRRIL